MDTREDHLSTFAMDVDTASYTKMRDYIRNGQLPPIDLVRVEEYLNYFN
jgi:Ca-activated chloride channel family protein